MLALHIIYVYIYVIYAYIYIYTYIYIYIFNHTHTCTSGVCGQSRISVHGGKVCIGGPWLVFSPYPPVPFVSPAYGPKDPSAMPKPEVGGFGRAEVGKEFLIWGVTLN